MPADITQADYDELQGCAREFFQQADAVQELLKSVQAKVDVLRGGDWVGANADKFYDEMDSAICPAIQKLGTALESAGGRTDDVSNIYSNAEEEAAQAVRNMTI